MTTVEPQQVIRLHSIPCAVCHLPAAVMEIYPAVRRVRHTGDFPRPCTIRNPRPHAKEAS